MKIVSFKYDGSKKDVDKNEVFFASIEIETGSLFWKKTETKQIFKKGYGWRFEDDGEYAHGCEALYDAHLARELRKRIK